MSIRKISLLLPMYKKADNGQTPVAYPHKVVFKFEAALVALSPALFKQAGLYEFVQDPMQGLQAVPRVCYDLWVDMATDTLSHVVALALASFDVKRVTVLSGYGIENMDKDSVERLITFLHPWCEE